ncbi:MAG: ABC transporter permease [Chloroflexi bacterium]|nr:ABC transporter permease [Chloroflexota bacterium]MBI3762247.1 ABC transporter permease [Chloroflexota bacterium]
MLGLKIERTGAPTWQRALIPLLAVLVTFALTSALVAAAKASPLEAFFYFFIEPFTARSSTIEILVKTTPLLLTGAAVAFAFAAGYYNIGAEGQLYAGAIAAAWLGPLMTNTPPVIAVPLMIAAGFAAGMLWALPPAWLKARLAVDEVVTTLLLNSVIVFFASALLNGPWRDPVSLWPQSPTIAKAAQFPVLLARSRLHLGALVGLVAITAFGLILSRTAFGLKMRAVGLGQNAARFMGVNVPRTILVAALVSGGIAGVAGAGEVAGIHYHLIEAISPGYGYSGIVVATLGGLNAIGVGLAALFIGLIITGAQEVSRALSVPSYLADIVQATLLLVTLAMLLLGRYRIRRA